MKQTPTNLDIDYISRSLNKFQDKLIKCATKSELNVYTMRIGLIDLLSVLLNFNKKVGDGSWKPRLDGPEEEP